MIAPIERCLSLFWDGVNLIESFNWGLSCYVSFITNISVQSIIVALLFWRLECGFLRLLFWDLRLQSLGSQQLAPLVELDVENIEFRINFVEDICCFIWFYRQYQRLFNIFCLRNILLYLLQYLCRCLGDKLSLAQQFSPYLSLEVGKISFDLIDSLETDQLL